MDLILPLPVRVSSITPRIISSTAAPRSIFSGATRTLARAGDHFGFTIKVMGASDRESFPMRAALRALLSSARGQANRIWVMDPSYRPRGSFPTGELILNGDFRNGLTGWSAGSSAFLLSSDGFIWVQNGAASYGYATNTAAVGIANNASYVARSLSFPGQQGTFVTFMNGGPTTGTQTYFATTTGNQGLSIASFTASGTTFFLMLAGSNVSGESVNFQFASLSRCALVNGASQTGMNLNVKKLPSGVPGLLLPGDRVQIGNQLNTIAAPLYGDGSGNGYMQCVLPWRVSPADGAPVIIDRPMARCILVNNSNSWDESPGGFADFQFDVEESLDA